MKQGDIEVKGRETKRFSHPLVQSAARLWGGEAVSPLSPPQSTTLKRGDLGGEQSAASDEDILSEGGVRGMRETAPRGMKPSLHSIQEKPQGDIRGGAVFNIRHARLGMKEGTLPKKTRKCRVVKDITRLFKSDALKTLGTF